MMSGDVLKRVLVIGISGTTNSGKTTLVQRLLVKYGNSNKICQDHFFMAPQDPRLAPLYLPEVNHHNWEDFRALEMDRMVETVKKKIKMMQDENHGEQPVLFVDGFSIFGWNARHYDPPDVPGYFEAVVWPEHLKHLEAIKDQKDIVYIDGNEGVENLYQLICRDIDSFSTTPS